MKKIVALCAALIIVLCSLLSVCAADGKVIYSGNSKKFIFEPGSDLSPSDIFPEFKNVMPGDSITQKLTLKNEASNDVKVNIFIRSLGAKQGSEEFLSKLRLKVKKSLDNDMAYMFDAAADETAGLTDWVYLGTLYSGGKVNLDVILSVPTELDNKYQSDEGYLEWEFKIEEFPVEDTDPEPPYTGTGTNIKYYIVVMGGCVLMIVILFVWRRKDKNKD